MVAMASLGSSGRQHDFRRVGIAIAAGDDGRSRGERPFGSAFVDKSKQARRSTVGAATVHRPVDEQCDHGTDNGADEPRGVDASVLGVTAKQHICE